MPPKPKQGECDRCLKELDLSDPLHTCSIPVEQPTSNNEGERKQIEHHHSAFMTCDENCKPPSNHDIKYTGSSKNICPYPITVCGKENCKVHSSPSNNEVECGKMILTSSPEHQGGMACAEKKPCKFHPTPTPEKQRQAFSTDKKLSEASKKVAEILEIENTPTPEKWEEEFREKFESKKDIPGWIHPARKVDDAIAFIRQTRQEARQEALLDVEEMIEDWFSLAPRYRTKKAILSALQDKLKQIK